jgi:Xaa-Pro aminopeptidase
MSSADRIRAVPDVLIFADTIRSPELRHEIPLPVPDAFLYLERDGKRTAVVSSLEAARIREAAPDVDVVELERFGNDELIAQGMPPRERELEIALRACRGLGIANAIVPPGFPLELADHLRANGVQLTAAREFFEARRRVKNIAQIEGIRRAQRACEAALDAARDLLRRANASNGTLTVDDEPLTCERLRRAVENAFGEHGVAADEIVVSHGAQTAIGHEMGHGAIARGEPIVFDLFPRDRTTGCYSDMTRTYVVGGAPDELRAFHRLAKQALDEALASTRAGVNGRTLMEQTCNLFHEHGYPTQLHKRPGEVLEEGFFHGLGHGVGLDVHERPWVSRFGDDLVAGDVITLEPGLYRQGFGGVRLEDIVLVTENGCENLTQYPYDLEP